MGLDPRKHLGKDIGFLKSYLHRLKEYVESFFSVSFSTLFIGKAFIKFYEQKYKCFVHSDVTTQVVWD